VDSLRDHANVRRTARVNGVVAGVYVTPTCGGNGPGGQATLRCADVDDNCYPLVMYRAFFDFLLHNHIINIKKHFSFSGEVKDSVISLFFFYFTRELNLYSPLIPILSPHPKDFIFIKPLVLPPIL
jgi:hypothetical protein